MDARQSETGVSFGMIRPASAVAPGLPLQGERLFDHEDASETSIPGPQRAPKWPVVGLLGGIGLSGAWVGVLFWLVGRWIGFV